jgi:S-formylglutathione hydrolase FrmB
MAFMEIRFFSETLGRGVCVNALIPQGKKSYKTLYLFHGLSDDHTAWQRYTSIEMYALRAGIAVIMPNVDRSFYADMANGDKYFTYISEELPKVMRGFFGGMSDKREDNFAAGLSMGGYGAFKLALTYPDRYAAACSLSGALDIPYMIESYPIGGKKELFGNIYGDLSSVAGSENDLLALLEKCVTEGKEIPKLYMACGLQDVILPCSRTFFEKANALSVPVSYVEAEGNHNWYFWDKHIQTFTDLIPTL